MEPAGDASDSSGTLPARQTWYPARRRLFIVLFTILSASYFILAIAARAGSRFPPTSPQNLGTAPPCLMLRRPGCEHVGVTTTRLRPLRQTDVPDVLAAFLSATDMARQGDVKTLDDADTYIRRLTAPGGPHRPWSVTESDVVVGLVGVSVDAANRNGWFWYWLHAAHRGRGLASRAAATVANWSLSDGGLQRLELGHRVDNPASGAVARAAGFVQEGREREKFLIDGDRVDVLTYGRLRSDPPPATATVPMA